MGMRLKTNVNVKGNANVNVNVYVNINVIANVNVNGNVNENVNMESQDKHVWCDMFRYGRSIYVYDLIRTSPYIDIQIVLLCRRRDDRFKHELFIIFAIGKT